VFLNEKHKISCCCGEEFFIGEEFCLRSGAVLRIIKIFFKPEIKVLQYIAIPEGFENFHRMSMFDGFVKSRFCLIIKI